MDKTGITAVVICVALLVGWFYESQKYESYVAQQRAAAQANAAASQPATTSASITSTAITTNDFSLSPNAPEKILTLTNSNARYTFTSRGGGIKFVELLNYPETISARWKPANTNDVVTLNAGAPVPILSILGDPAIVGDGDLRCTG